MAPASQLVRAPQTDLERKRRAHTRSKTGCVRCRLRHIRCDEHHPSCLKCLTWGVNCVYTSCTVRLGKESFLPGVQTIWHQASPLPGLAGDLFAYIPIRMPHKSLPLMHHFIEVHDELAQFLPPGSKPDFLKLASEDSPIFRTVLLVAASHYSMQSGGLHHYEKAYHFHMGEIIHDLNVLVNNLDNSTPSIARIARLVATLCMIETRIGNFTAAEAHLEGLLTLLDMVDQNAPSVDIYDGISYLENCFTLAHVFLSGLLDQCSESYPEHFRFWPVHRHQKTDAFWSDLETRLRALSFSPFFVQKAPCPIWPEQINVYRLLPIGHDITSHRTEQTLHTSPSNGDATGQSVITNTPGHHDLVSAAFGIGDILTWFASARRRRTEALEAPKPGFTVEPLPFYIASGQYYSWILGVRPSTRTSALHVRIERRKLQILRRGLDRSEQRMKAGEVNRELWLWQAYCGLLGHEIFWSRHLSYEAASTDSEAEELRSWFVGRIGIWARVTGVTKWSGAQAALRTIVWPELSSVQELAERIWSKAMETGESDSEYGLWNF